MVRVYNALNKNQNYQNVILAQTKALTLLSSQVSNAKITTDIDINTILNPFEIELSNINVSSKYKEYIRSLKTALTTSLNAHFQEIERNSKILDGQKLIENYSSQSLVDALQTDINKIEKEILQDASISRDEQVSLLLATTQTYQKAKVIGDLFGGSSASNGRIQWSWGSFFKVVAAVVAIAVVVVATIYVGPAILTAVNSLGINATLISATSAIGSIVGGVTVASATTSVVASYLGSKMYCMERLDCDNCDSFGLIGSFAKCSPFD